MVVSPQPTWLVAMRFRRRSFCWSRDISRRKRQGRLEFSETRPPHFLQATEDRARGVIALQRPLENHPDHEVRIEWETLFLEFSAQMVRTCRRESLDVVAQPRSG